MGVELKKTAVLKDEGDESTIVVSREVWLAERPWHVRSEVGNAVYASNEDLVEFGRLLIELGTDAINAARALVEANEQPQSMVDCNDRCAGEPCVHRTAAE